MPPKVPKLLAFFRGRRLAIPLIAAGIVLFAVLGGPQKVMNLVVGGMTGFLAGTAPVDGEVAGQAEGAPEVVAAGHAEVVPKKEPTRDLISGSFILEHVGPAAAMAASSEVAADTMMAPEPTGAMTWVDSLEASIVDSLEARRSIKAYTAYYLRDPFFSLIAAGRDRPTKLLDVSRAKMVGSVWGESGIIALLEDDTGRSYALKVGDRVVNGSVVSITPASITFSISMFGLSKTVTLEIAEEGEW